MCTKDLAFCGDNTYKQNDLIKMERKILVTLDFEIAVPTIYDFLAANVGYCPALTARPQIAALTYYLGEVALQSR